MKMDTTGQGESLAQRWNTLDGQRGELKTRTEDYASWTLPYIFPPLNTEGAELQGPNDSIGARATNHLANKLVQTLFTAHRPFFRVVVTQDAKDELVQRVGDEGEAQQFLAQVEQAMANAERAGIAEMDKHGYRTAATLAAKSLIITGNSLVYWPEKGKVQVYSLRDYVVVRDVDGIVIEIITRDCKAFETFSEEVQAQLTAGKQKRRGSQEKVHIYTQIKLENDGKYHVQQYADEVKLDSEAMYPADLLPWTVLSWNLVRGEHYGRGLVEDFAGAFHSIDVLTDALVTGAAIAADIKFLVDPSSMLDVQELNKSKSGSYHTGREGDITCPQLMKQLDFQLAQTLLERFERQISQAFLMANGTTRQAERVTAEEIRRDAIELEQSLGGIYSHLAEEWQNPTAHILLDRINFQAQDAFVPQIVTGMDTLARTGDLDNIQLFFYDLSQINNVPEEYRGIINPHNMMRVIGTARGVDYLKFMKSEDQFAQEQKDRMAQEQQLIMAQGQQQVAVEAGKQAAKETAQ